MTRGIGGRAMNPSSVDPDESVTRQSRQLRLMHVQHYALAVLSVSVALVASLLLQHFHFRVSAAPLLLFAVAISAWYGGTGPAVLAAALSIVGFYWYFVEPVRTIYMYPSEIPFFIVFVAFVALLSWFSVIRRRVEKDLRDQADLLNLTHDTIFVMGMEGVIKYWNRGAEERYGYTAQQAVGKGVHDLLKTVFPAPLEAIKAEVTRTGSWEGELVHTKRDGTSVTLASRWALQRDERGAPLAILETNNDVTERKRAEQDLRRLNRELKAISNCNQTLLRATDEQSLLEEICRIVCEEAGYRMAFVAYAEHDEAKSARPVAWAGAEEGYLKTADLTWTDTERGCGPTGTAIRSAESCCIQDLAMDPRVAPWTEGLLQRGSRSAIAFPLKDEHGRVFGALTICSAEVNSFTPAEIALLEELAGDLAYGITAFRTRAERQRSDEALRINEARYRTAEAVGHVGNWEYDVRTNTYWGSDEAKRMFGFDPGQTDFTIDEVENCIPERDRVHQALVDLIEAGKPYNLEFEMRPRSSTEVRIMSSVAQLLRDEQREALKVVGSIRDITERKRAEEALRRSEAHLSEAQRLTHVGAWANNAAGQPVYWSEELFRIWGFDPQRGIPTRDQAVQRIHPEDLDKYWQFWQSVIRPNQEKVDLGFEFRIVLPDGTVKHLYGLAHSVFNSSGELLELVGTTMDITERKRAEEALRLYSAYNRSLIEASVDPLVTIGPDGKITDVNAATEAATGHSRRELIGTDFCDCFTEPAKASAGYEHVFREGMVRDYPLELRHRDGRVLSVLYNASVYRDESGQVIGVFAAARNITERKRAEEALRKSEARLAEAQRLTHAGSWALDAATREITYWSEEMFRIYGVHPQHGIPPMEAMGRRIHPEDRSRVHGTFEKSLREKVDTSEEYRLVLPSGTVKHVHVIRHPVLNTAGDIVELVGTFVDITERKLAEEERERLRQLESDLAHINRISMMGELAAAIAHEVNQPLSGIVSNASASLRFLAEDAPNLEEVREAVHDIVRDGKRAGEIIARIRALTKRTAAAQEKLDLNETIQEVLTLVGDEARRNRVMVRTQFADDLSVVAGDRVQLQQVVLNLVINAMEAMSSIHDRARELVITTRNINTGDVQVTVEDSGIGLAPNAIDKVFNSFYTTKPGGMGMGLSVSRSILQAHEGRLWVTAKDSPGTMFHFTIPKYREKGLHAGATGT